MKQLGQTGTILKWVGGKEKELPMIFALLPKGFKEYYEPFVGGGACYMAMNADHYYINDRCRELIQLYRNLISNKKFYEYARCINQAWKNIAFAFYAIETRLMNLYKDFSFGRMSYMCFDNAIKDIACGIVYRDIFILPFTDPSDFVLECRFNIVRSMSRMSSAQKSGKQLSNKDISQGIKTAFKASVYTYLCNLFNSKKITEEFETALFMFLTTYCINGHFKYKVNGNFEMPYAGKSYNDKYLDSRLAYYRSDRVRNKLAKTYISNSDFSTFFKRNRPSSNDFIFADPPDEGIYNRYGNHGFSLDDHRRLAEYLLHDCSAKWILAVKDTSTIRHLYFGRGLTIWEYGKSGAELFITNYNDYMGNPSTAGLEVAMQNV